MASFYNAETNEPVTKMYIASSGKGRVILEAPGRTGTGMMSMPAAPRRERQRPR